MFNKVNLFKNYIKHWFLAKDEHSLHSPFMFEFYNEGVKKRISKTNFTSIEKIRQSLLKNNLEIEVVDFGAGSKINNTHRRTLSKISKTSLSPSKKCRLLYKIIDYLEPRNIIELGTSLGITTSYLALVNQENNVYSLEGCPNIAKIAQQNFKELNLNNIQLILGNIDDTLPELLESIEYVDIIFFDGNHTKEATINYFEITLERVNQNTLFIFDDIYWSKGMQEAWEIISQREEVKLSVDLFDFGLVFFRNNQPKQHFILKW